MTNISNKRTAKNAKTALYWLPPMKTTATASRIPNMQPIPMSNQGRKEFLEKFILKRPTAGRFYSLRLCSSAIIGSLLL